ncbi:permease prefix domain 1-containing protein [Saccharopolyspora taberi]|uniref:Uncharacterized protein n=1 Tax=Saccharopolyspora taberi TaxID=60895 RepID=A0ABN3VP46_9PSEU
MTAISQTTAIDSHVAALSAALHGPAKEKARMVREAHDGLTDAAAALTEHGVPADRAAAQAVRDFGAVDELRPVFQRELTLAQVRRTAALVALTGAVLVGCRQLTNAVAPYDQGGIALRITGVLAMHLGGAVAVAAVFAAVALAVTGPLGRLLPTPHRLPLVMAWTATSASAALGVSALALAVASASTGNWLLVPVIGTLVMVSHVKVGSSARACRECAQLS